MSIRHLGSVLSLGACWALVGCATPKASEPASTAPATAGSKDEPAAADTPPPSQADEGLRVGNLLVLPEERETRSSTAGTGAASRPGGGAVTVTPPAPQAPPATEAPPKPADSGKSPSP
jgi:hypothetical protein